MLRSALDIIFISSYAASRRAGGGGSTSRLYYGEYSDAFLSAATCTSFVLAEAKCIHLLCLEDDDFLLFSIHTSSFSHILYSSVSTVCLQHISFCLFFFFFLLSRVLVSHAFPRTSSLPCVFSSSSASSFSQSALFLHGARLPPFLVPAFTRSNNPSLLSFLFPINE